MTKVAIFDDHAVVRMGLKYAIVLAGDMELAFEQEDGRNAAALVLTEQPDVILLDIRMPEVDGISALESILVVRPSAKVIMLTTSEAEEDVYRAIKLGAEGGTFFPDAVKQVYRQRQMMPDLTARETEVLQMIAKGLSNHEIGHVLGVGAETIKIHLKHIFDKLAVANRAECVAEAIRRGFMKL